MPSGAPRRTRRPSSGDDMCLSSEEYCLASDDCTGATTGEANCRPLDEDYDDSSCEGDEGRGILCVNDCG